jgi:hypothetical protein
MSIRETDREVTTTIHYRATCTGCRKRYVEFTIDTDIADMLSGGYEADRAAEILADADWTVVSDITDLDRASLLCPDCPPCEEVGHSWYPTVAGDRIGCRICGVTPHAPLTGGATAAGMAELRTTASV